MPIEYKRIVSQRRQRPRVSLAQVAAEGAR
jgi:hypothetical protein